MVSNWWYWLNQSSLYKIDKIKYLCRWDQSHQDIFPANKNTILELKLTTITVPFPCMVLQTIINHLFHKWVSLNILWAMFLPSAHHNTCLFFGKAYLWTKIIFVTHLLSLLRRLPILNFQKIRELKISKPTPIALMKVPHWKKCRFRDIGWVNRSLKLKSKMKEK